MSLRISRWWCTLYLKQLIVINSIEKLFLYFYMFPIFYSINIFLRALSCVRYFDWLNIGVILNLLVASVSHCLSTDSWIINFFFFINTLNYYCVIPYTSLFCIIILNNSDKCNICFIFFYAQCHHIVEFTINYNLK